MNFPKFWARGKSGAFAVWRSSDTSVNEAREAAQAAAERLAALFEADNLPDEKYGYGNRPMREPVLKEMRNAAGELSAAVTRNSYGCQVLNTTGALFVDIDLPEPKKSGGMFGSLFGKRAEPEDPAKTAMAKAGAWAQAHPGWNWRTYRTRGGLRLLATHALFDPSDPVCEQVFDGGRCGSVISQTVPDAEVLSRAADAEAVAMQDRASARAVAFCRRGRGAGV